MGEGTLRRTLREEEWKPCGTPIAERRITATAGTKEGPIPLVPLWHSTSVQSFRLEEGALIGVEASWKALPIHLFPQSTTAPAPTAPALEPLDVSSPVAKPRRLSRAICLSALHSFLSIILTPAVQEHQALRQLVARDSGVHVRLYCACRRPEPQHRRRVSRSKTIPD